MHCDYDCLKKLVNAHSINLLSMTLNLCCLWGVAYTQSLTTSQAHLTTQVSPLADMPDTSMPQDGMDLDPASYVPQLEAVVSPKQSLQETDPESASCVRRQDNSLSSSVEDSQEVKQFKKLCNVKYIQYFFYKTIISDWHECLFSTYSAMLSMF